MSHILVHPRLQANMARLGASMELPALPDIYQQFQKAMAHSDANSKKAAQILGSEPSLVMKILRTINSAAYSLRQPVHKVEQAISLLGLNEISKLVLASSLIQQYPLGKGDRFFDMKKFWEHSLGVAVCARVLSRHMRRRDPAAVEESFIAGLVHDVGKIVQHQYFYEDFTQAMNLCRQDQLTLVMAEQKVFGYTHQDVGAYIADSWGLSRNVVKAQELHNTPEELDQFDDSFLLVSVIHVANILAHYLRLGSSGDPYIPKLWGNCYDGLGIPITDIATICGEARTAYAELHQELLGAS